MTEAEQPDPVTSTMAHVGEWTRIALSDAVADSTPVLKLGPVGGGGVTIFFRTEAAFERFADTIATFRDHTQVVKRRSELVAA